MHFSDRCFITKRWAPSWIFFTSGVARVDVFLWHPKTGGGLAAKFSLYHKSGRDKLWEVAKGWKWVDYV